jgi:hypothetical protein
MAVVVDGDFHAGGNVRAREEFPFPKGGIGMAGVVEKTKGGCLRGLDVPPRSELQAHPCPRRGFGAVECSNVLSGGNVPRGEDAEAAAGRFPDSQDG